MAASNPLGKKVIKRQLTRFPAVAVSFLTLLAMTTPGLAAEPTVQKAVLVTGASSGIGRNIAERLASEGYFVYAGARKDKDLQALSNIDNIQGVRFDVTIQSEIDAAVKTVEAGGRGLYGIVNNARVSNSSSCAQVERVLCGWHTRGRPHTIRSAARSFRGSVCVPERRTSPRHPCSCRTL